MNHPRHGGILRHSVLLMSVTLVANACNLGFQAAMGWMLEPKQYGILYSMMGVILVVATPLDAIRTSMAHFAARLSQAGRLGDIRRLVWRWAGGVLLFSVPLALLGVALSGPLAAFFRLESRLPLVLTLLMVAGLPIQPVLVGTLQGVQAFWRMALAAHSWSIVRVAVGAALVVGVAARAEFGLIAQAVGVVVSLSLGVFGLRQVLGGAPAGEHVPGVKTYFFRSLLALAGFGVLMNADGILLKHYFAPEDAGLFARAWLIGRSIVFLPMPIALAMFPKVASAGETADHAWKTLLKALLLAGVVIGGAVVAGTLFPHLALLILYHDAAPEAWMLRLVRLVIWSMSPLALAYLVLNFELAQHRFRTALLVLPCALAYLAGVVVLHRSPFQVAAVLGVTSTTALALLLMGLPWRRRQGTPNAEGV